MLFFVVIIISKYCHSYCCVINENEVFLYPHIILFVPVFVIFFIHPDCQIVNICAVNRISKTASSFRVVVQLRTLSLEWGFSYVLFSIAPFDSIIVVYFFCFPVCQLQAMSLSVFIVMLSETFHTTNNSMVSCQRSQGKSLRI